MLLACVARLGEEFRRRGMTEHVRLLKLYFLDVRHRLLRGPNELDVRWSESHVVDWMKALRLPPFESALPVRWPGAGCSRCGIAQSTVPSGRTELVFPGGARLRCQSCGDRWLELESTGPQ